MSTPDDLLEWAFKGLVALMGALLAWIWVKNDNRSDQQDRRTAAIENMVQELRLEHVNAGTELTKLRLHVSENYSGKAETQQSLARVHEKIEKLNDDVIKHLGELRSDLREDITAALSNLDMRRP